MVDQHFRASVARLPQVLVFGPCSSRNAEGLPKGTPASSDFRRRLGTNHRVPCYNHEVQENHIIQCFKQKSPGLPTYRSTSKLLSLRGSRPSFQLWTWRIAGSRDRRSSSRVPRLPWIQSHTVHLSVYYVHVYEILSIHHISSPIIQAVSTELNKKCSSILANV